MDKPCWIGWLVGIAGTVCLLWLSQDLGDNLKVAAAVAAERMFKEII